MARLIDLDQSQVDSLIAGLGQSVSLIQIACSFNHS
jgi:hypothetical protein